MRESEERLKELCNRATQEEDAEKVREIVGEILKLLAERQSALVRPPNQK